ncbi:hypothetical protein V6N12_001147 [Hibiscus sabdariffa]|uniref:MULE transposase domain-containing protein n=1 Tax=Hibiscus sabdariffa TaxID=183260 RepID=A0ABR2C6F0_9ROSI
MTLEHDEGNGANVFDEGPAENNGLNGIDESVNEIVGEVSNNIDGDISGSDWVDGDNILSDDDDELASLKNKFNVVSKKIKNKTITVEDLEPDVALEIIKFSNGLIEEDLGGLGREAVEPRFQLGMIFESQQQLKDTLCAYVVAHSFDFRLAREELKVDLHKRTCLKARKWALEKIRGNVVHEFNRLFDYVFALRSADPNGTFDLIVERPTDVATPKFKRLYVCFSVLKEGFKRFCRPIISLDGCYLKGEIKDEILLALGKDGNNQFFPIAWALVEVENRETWAWFLENIQRDLNLGDGSKFTLISTYAEGKLILTTFITFNV